jgi:hypothetical protein
VYVEVDLTADPAEVALHDAADLGSLKVVVRDSDGGPAALYAALDGLGWLDGSGNALLRTDALKRMAGDLAADERWLRSFERMVEYAATRGWVALEGSALKAHCEWREA